MKRQGLWPLLNGRVDLNAGEMLTRLQQLREAGRVLSAANTKLVQQIHDAAGGLPPGPGRDQVQTLAKSLLAGAESSHDAARQNQAGASQTDSLSQNDLKKTPTGGTDTFTAGQGDAKAGGQAGPTLQLPDGDMDDKFGIKGPGGMYGSGANADRGEAGRVSFGAGASTDLPSGDRADDGAEPKVDASDNKQTKSGKFREADDKTTDANTDIAPKIPLHKLDTKIQKNRKRKENDVDAGEADGADMGDGSKSDFIVKARESVADVDAAAIADKALAEAGYSMPNEFASQDAHGAEKPNKVGTAGASVSQPSSSGSGAALTQDGSGDEKTDTGHRAADAFDDPAKAKDIKGQGDLKAQPPVHLDQNAAAALSEAMHARAATYYEHLLERDFSTKQRKKLADKGYAMPDGSYPIETRGDLANAVQAFGRSPDDATKAHIKKRARALGAADVLPDSWKEAAQPRLALVREADGDDPPKGKVEDGEFEGDDFRKHGADADGLMQESARPVLEDCQIIEAVGGEGKEWDVLLIETGWSKNGNYYPADTLRNGVRLFEGAYCFIDHSTEAERRTRPERSIRDKVGWFTDVRYGQAQVGGRLTEGIVGRFHLVDEDLRSKLREAVAMGKPDFIGFSIDATGRCAQRRNIGGKIGTFVEAITKVHSVDLVTDPAAGGQLMRLVAANRSYADGELNNQLEGMTEVELKTVVESAVKEAVQATTEALTKQFETQVASLREASASAKVENLLSGARISDAGKTRIREAFADLVTRRDFTADEVQAQIREVQNYEAAVLNQHIPVPARFREAGHIEMGSERFDKYSLALTGWFEGQDQKDKDGAGVPRFRSLKEAYCRWYGVDALELDPLDLQEEFFNFGGARGYSSRKDHKRVRESLTTASWGSIYADHLYLKLMRDYNMLPYTTMWQQVVSEIEDVPDFQTRHWDRVGGYSDLPVISEQGTYNTLTSPTNEEVTYAISKKGGLDDVTFEAIVNDRVGSIRRIPTHMARAAARTLWKTVFNTITTLNPTMSYDTTALYAAGHGNNDTNALSLNAMDTGIQKMRQQTAFGESAEILGPRNLPRTLIVPNQLEQRAKRIVNPSEHYLIHDTADTATNIDPASFTSYGINVLVYDVLTSATTWFMVADPQQVETMVVGFLNGQQEPEMFVQDQPNVGSVFSADKITYKIRHIYGMVVLDHRSFYKGNA